MEVDAGRTAALMIRDTGRYSVCRVTLSATRVHGTTRLQVDVSAHSHLLWELGSAYLRVAL